MGRGKKVSSKQGRGGNSPSRKDKIWLLIIRIWLWAMGVLSVVSIIISFLIINYGTEFSQALWNMTFGFIGVVVISIILIHKKGKDYSHPLWVVSLGLITTFIGFTLSGSLQEIMKDREENAKLKRSLYLMTAELAVQKEGLEETMFDFYSVLFEESDEGNQRKRFYVSKEPSVYSKSDIKNTILSDLDLVDANNTLELNELMLSVGSVPEIYDGLTFQSNDPQEMLESYLEVISLRYEVRKQINIVNAQFEYLNGTSWDKVKEDMERDEKSLKEESLEIINEQIKLTAKKYPDVHIEIDVERLID